jgi:radical SAM superfamily enzyme YgiQ (UPF0313 family)
MIIQGQWLGTAYTLSLKDSSLAVSIGAREIIVYDRAGRLYSCNFDDQHHRRSLSGQILQKWSIDNLRQRRWLAPIEADALIDRAAQRMRELIGALNSPDWNWIMEPDRPEQLIEYLLIVERGAQFDSAAAAWDAARFQKVYNPIGMLPPDQYLALVLEATQGCTFNSCAFCDLYQQPFKVKSPIEFERHIAEVRNYLGDSILLRRRSIFLGAANALAVPMARLQPLLEIANTEFSRLPLSLKGQGNNSEGEIELYAFLDAFTGTHKTIDDYRTLAQLGLRRVYLGLESGHDPLLHLVHKPGQSIDAIETVRMIKAAGINVGVIVMIGLGGDKFSRDHIQDTAATLNAMHLSTGDLLYFSDLVERPHTHYPALAQDHSIRSLTPLELGEQRKSIRHQLYFAGIPPKISSYDIREFVY